MSFFNRGLLVARLPVVECKRFKQKYNTKRPRIPHYDRQLMIDVCLPSFVIKKPDTPPCEMITRKAVREKVHNPLEHILAKEVYNWLAHSHMVGFLHLNSVKQADSTKLFNLLRKNDMHMRKYGKKIMQMATDNTPYEAIQCLFSSHTNIVFSEKIQITEFLKILKKTPQLVLMAAIIDGKLVTRNQIEEYANLPNIAMVRAQLCNVMLSGANQVVSHLNHHQSALVGYLDAHVEQLSKLQIKDIVETKTEGKTGEADAAPPEDQSPQ